MPKNKKIPLMWIAIIFLSIWIVLNFIAFSMVLEAISDLHIDPTLIAGSTVALIITLYIAAVGIKEFYRVSKGAKVKKIKKEFWIKRDWEASKLLTILEIWLLAGLLFFDFSIISVIDIGIISAIFWLKRKYAE